MRRNCTRDGKRFALACENPEGKVAGYERLSVVGTRAFSDRRLRQVLETKQAGLLRQIIQRDTFVAERLELDKQLLRDFYLARGYADVQVLDATSDVARERDAFFVTFTIREGQQFRIGQVSTVSEIEGVDAAAYEAWLLYTSPSPRDPTRSRMPSSALKKKKMNMYQVTFFTLNHPPSTRQCASSSQRHSTAYKTT